MDVPAALYLLNKMGVANDFRRSAPIFRERVTPRRSQRDAKTLRIRVRRLCGDRTAALKRIDEKWFGRTINWHEPYFTYAGYAAGAALLLIAALFGWNRVLSRKVLQRTAALGESEQRFRQIAENIREVFWAVRY